MALKWQLEVCRLRESFLTKLKRDFFRGRGTYLFIPCLRAHVRWRSSTVYLNPPVWSIILIAIDHIDYCKTKIKESDLFLIISLHNKELEMKYLFSEDQLSSLIMSNNLVSFIYSTKPLGLPCYSNEVFNEDLSLFHSDIVEFHFFYVIRTIGSLFWNLSSLSVSDQTLIRTDYLPIPLIINNWSVYCLLILSLFTRISLFYRYLSFKNSQTEIWICLDFSWIQKPLLPLD